MTEGIQKPNCPTCPLMKEWYHKVPEFLYCTSRNEEISPSEQQLISKVGCLLNPNAREYLMQDVINDLMGIASVYRNENDDYANGIEKAIALIRGVR